MSTDIPCANRERNKVLARKTRVRKKAELEALLDQMVSLVTKNQKLRDLVRERLSYASVADPQLLHSNIQLPNNIQLIVKQLLDQRQISDRKELTAFQQSFCIIKMKKKHCNHSAGHSSSSSISSTTRGCSGADQENGADRFDTTELLVTFASEAFYRLTGYEPSAVVNRSIYNIFQGPGQDEAGVRLLPKRR